MSLNDLSKDELILRIQSLEKEKIKLKRIEWEYSLCDCEFTTRYCNQLGCKASSISGKNLRKECWDCFSLKKCKQCSTKVYARGFEHWDPVFYYCDEHMDTHKCLDNIKLFSYF